MHHLLLSKVVSLSIYLIRLRLSRGLAVPRVLDLYPITACLLKVGIILNLSLCLDHSFSTVNVHTRLRIWTIDSNKFGVTSLAL